MTWHERLGIPGMRRRRTKAQTIVRLARGLTDIPSIETRLASLIGPKGSSSNDRVTASHPDSTPPTDPDPTGALQTLARMDDALDDALDALTRYDHLREGQLRRPQPEDFDLTDTIRPADACEWHWAAFRLYEPSHTTNPTTVGGTLPAPSTICSPCYERVRQLGHQPRRPDLDEHRRSGKWPKREIRTNASKKRR